MADIYLNRILFLTITCGLIIGFTLPVYELTDLEKYRLKGKIKSIMEIKYALAEGADKDPKDNITYQKYTLFDLNGYETESVLYKNGEKYLVSSYLSGSDGKQLEMNEYNPDGTLNLNVTFKFDDKGFRSEAIYNWAENRKIGEICDNTDYYYEIIQNDMFTKVIYKNEYRGFCTEEIYLKADSSLSFKIIAKYDFHGNKTESGYYHGNGHLSWMTKYKYDRYDNLVESRVYKSNRIAVVSGYDFQFDETGNWVTRKENREVFVNILTEGLERDNTLTERIIEYY
jgi:hypothetical protein